MTVADATSSDVHVTDTVEVLRRQNGGSPIGLNVLIVNPQDSKPSRQ